MRCISELSEDDKQRYTVCVEGSEQQIPEVVIMLIQKGRSSCFHMAATWTNPDIEHAKAVCSQAILERTDDGDASLYFAVHDSYTDRVHFCLCDPSQQTFEDVSQYSIRNEPKSIVTWLKTYVQSNAEVLHKKR
jgi:hypothetical protein